MKTEKFICMTITYLRFSVEKQVEFIVVGLGKPGRLL